MKVKTDLAKLADGVMKEKGLEPDFSKEELAQLSQINTPAPISPTYADLRSLLWCSIDNDDSKDLDQLTYAEKGSNGEMTLFVAVADVDALVPKGSPIDEHAQFNTTSVYTPAKIFPMLPEKLSTNLTSLNENEDRLSMVVKVLLKPSGELDLDNSLIFQAVVHNYAQLTYSAIGGWLEGKSALPDKLKRVPGLEENLKMQHTAAQALRKKRHEAGSLTLQSSDAEVKLEDNDNILVVLPPHNFAHQLIEEFMIGANRTMAHRFSEAKIPNLRRVVRTPKNWNRIVEVALELGVMLPEKPDSKALDAFLIKRRVADPETFPDLSLTIIKLLGRGEYVVENDQDHPIGHFALALTDYTHSTAPNRRYPDLITQRQYKAKLRGETAPYPLGELYRLATHCSEQEDAAARVQRQTNKSAAALLLSSHIGSVYKGIVTGANDKGTWVRIFEPAVEGKIVHGFEKLKVGDRIFVQLKHVDVPKGFIDFDVVKN